MVDIVGIDGRPLRETDEELQEAQTSRLGFLHREFESHPSRGLTPGKLVRILQQAEEGDIKAQCELYEDMEEKDGHIFAELSKRKRAILCLKWDIQPPKNATPAEEKETEKIKELVEDYLCLEDVIFDMGDAIGKAFSNQEMTWQRDNDLWYPEIEHRPASWFQLNRENRNELLLRNQTAEGEQLRPLNWISHVHKAKSGSIARASLLRVLAWPYLFKNYSVRDLAEFLEIYGLPLRLGKYQPGASNAEKATLMRAVVGIGHNAAGIIPDGMSIEFMDAAEGSNDPFDAMIAWCEKTQSKAILGGTLTSQADGASSTNALGNVHNEVRHDLMESDAKQMAKTINRDLIWPLVQLNTTITDLRRSPCFVFDTEQPEDVKLLSESLPPLVNLGLRVSAEEVRKRIGFKEPDKDEAVLAPSVAPGILPGQTNQAEATAVAALTRQTVDDEFDTFADDLAGEWEEVMSPSINPVLDALSTAKNYKDFEQKLVAATNEMDDEALIELLSNSAFASRVYGRLKRV